MECIDQLIHIWESHKKVTLIETIEVGDSHETTETTTIADTKEETEEKPELPHIAEETRQGPEHPYSEETSKTHTLVNNYQKLRLRSQMFNPWLKTLPM